MPVTPRLGIWYPGPPLTSEQAAEHERIYLQHQAEEAERRSRLEAERVRENALMLFLLRCLVMAGAAMIALGLLVGSPLACFIGGAAVGSGSALWWLDNRSSSG